MQFPFTVYLLNNPHQRIYFLIAAIVLLGTAAYVFVHNASFDWKGTAPTYLMVVGSIQVAAVLLGAFVQSKQDGLLQNLIAK
jgi:hypothetical protein